MKSFNLQRLGECAKSLLVAGIEIGLVCPFISSACSFQVPLLLQLGFSSVELEIAGKCMYVLALLFGMLACMVVVSGSFSQGGIGELRYFIALPAAVVLGYSLTLLHGIGIGTEAIPLRFSVACAVGILSGIVLTALRSVEEKNDGVVYTKKWIVELILDLVGFTADKPLWKMKALEPSCGDGSFLSAITERIAVSAIRDKAFRLDDIRDQAIKGLGLNGL